MARTRLLLLSLVALDAMGIGVVFPTLPELLRTLNSGGDLPRQYGLLLAVFALTSLLASPALGVMSDRMGRRPVLLFSLLGTAFDDLVMALAPSLWVLYVGRALAGMTGANITVLNACLADTTEESERASAFGQFNAAFGLGFVAGPVLGGLAGMFSLRAPFYAAAVLNLGGAVLCASLLPETRPERRPGRLRLTQLNPFAALLGVVRLRGIGSMLYVFCTMELVGQVPASIWVIYGMARFGWSPLTVGVSFAAFGVMHAAVQMLLPQRMQRWVGERGSILWGVALDVLGYALYSLARTTPAAFGAMPVMCLGGISLPAVQSLLSRSVGEERQGELQGVLTSFTSLVAVFGPLVASSLFDLARTHVPGYPGAIWLLPPLLYAPSVLLLFLRGHRRTRRDGNL